LNRDQKSAVIEEITGQIKESEAVLAVDYRGITVTQVGELRTQLRAADTTFRVTKNTLTERAADQADAEALKPLLEGPTALAFVRGDVAAAAKAIADYQRTTELLPFKGGILNGEALDPAQVTAISKLPSREVLYQQLVGVVASPISGLARTLNALVGGLAIALAAVNEKKQSGELPAGDAPAAAAAPADADAGAEAPDAGPDQDAEAPVPAASTEDPAEGPDTTTSET
jgi:large subunit ribosomal protein L10